MSATAVSEDLLQEGEQLYYRGVGWICQYESYWGELYWARNLPYFLRNLTLERRNRLLGELSEVENRLVSLNSDILLLEKHAA